MKKYRLWVGINRKMIYEGHLTFTMSNNEWKWKGNSKDTHESHFKSNKLMEGTPLTAHHKKKKQHEQIFEGDILEIAGEEIVVVIKDKRLGGFNTSPSISYADRGWQECMTDHLNSVKIIGNICENPELIPSGYNPEII